MECLAFGCSCLASHVVSRKDLFVATWRTFCNFCNRPQYTPGGRVVRSDGGRQNAAGPDVSGTPTRTTTGGGGSGSSTPSRSRRTTVHSYVGRSTATGTTTPAAASSRASSAGGGGNGGARNSATGAVSGTAVGAVTMSQDGQPAQQQGCCGAEGQRTPPVVRNGGGAGRPPLPHPATAASTLAADRTATAGSTAAGSTVGTNAGAGAGAAACCVPAPDTAAAAVSQSGAMPSPGAGGLIRHGPPAHCASPGRTVSHEDTPAGAVARRAQLDLMGVMGQDEGCDVGHGRDTAGHTFGQAVQVDAGEVEVHVSAVQRYESQQYGGKGGCGGNGADASGGASPAPATRYAPGENPVPFSINAADFVSPRSAATAGAAVGRRSVTASPRTPGRESCYTPSSAIHTTAAASKAAAATSATPTNVMARARAAAAGGNVGGGAGGSAGSGGKTSGSGAGRRAAASAAYSLRSSRGP